MRVIVVTGTSPHHKHLCIRLARRHEVVGIIHPATAPRTFGHSLEKLSHQVRKEGASFVVLHLLKNIAPIGIRQAGGPASPDPEVINAVVEYEGLPSSMIHRSCDVKSPDTHNLMRALRPDVTVCLGGPLYPAAFIDASPLMLNFHSGISPIYNGSSTIDLAFANGHINLCGGTLMLMGLGVDNGAILGHYLPSIEAQDSPATLFKKTVKGAIGMYERLLENLRVQPRVLHAIPQPERPLFYSRGVDIGWHHKVMAARHRRRGLPDRFARPEKVIEYWRESDFNSAALACRQTIEHLLWG